MLTILRKRGKRMNPVFVFLVLLAGFLVWLLGSFLYRPIGKIVKKLFEKADTEISYIDEEDEE